MPAVQSLLLTILLLNRCLVRTVILVLLSSSFCSSYLYQRQRMIRASGQKIVHPKCLFVGKRSGAYKNSVIPATSVPSLCALRSSFTRSTGSSSSSSSSSASAAFISEPLHVKAFIDADILQYLQLPKKKRKLQFLLSRSAASYGAQHVRDLLEKKNPALLQQPYRLRFSLPGQSVVDHKQLVTGSSLVGDMIELANKGESSCVHLFIQREAGLFPPPTATKSALLPAADPLDSPSYTMLSFYSFARITNPEDFADQLRSLWTPFRALGRIYVAQEGVNAQMAVPTNVFTDFERVTKSVLPAVFADTMLNADHVVPFEQYHRGAQPFKHLHVRTRGQIVADGLDRPLDWKTGPTGTELSPGQWHQAIANLPDNALLLDCRNIFESDVGLFQGAQPLNTNTFRESWDALREILGVEEDAHNNDKSNNNKDQDAASIMGLMSTKKEDDDIINSSSSNSGGESGGNIDERISAVPAATKAEIQAKIAAVPKDAPIYTYCTGGIRCVKINGFLEQELGFNNTYRLKGGIISYVRDLEAGAIPKGGSSNSSTSTSSNITTTNTNTNIINRIKSGLTGAGKLDDVYRSAPNQTFEEEDKEEEGAKKGKEEEQEEEISDPAKLFSTYFPRDIESSLFKGVNYVFDDRIGTRVTSDVLAKGCETCGALKIDTYLNCRNDLCNVRYIQCPNCRAMYNGCCSMYCKSVYGDALTRQDEQDKLHAPRRPVTTAVNSSSSSSSSTNTSSNSKINTRMIPRISRGRRDGSRLNSGGDERGSVDKKNFSTVASSGVHHPMPHAAAAAAASVSPLGGAISSSQLDEYCESHSFSEPALLCDLRRTTVEHMGVTAAAMQSSSLQGKVLSFLCSLTNANSVLELGAFTGYSALSFAHGMALTTAATAADEKLLNVKEVHTCEVDDRAIALAEPYIATSNDLYADTVRIKLHRMKAIDLIKESRERGDKYDLVFIDAEKLKYMDYISAVLGEFEEEEEGGGVGERQQQQMKKKKGSIVRSGGLIVVDNTLWKGLVLNAAADSEGAAALKQQEPDTMVTTTATAATAITATGDTASVAVPVSAGVTAVSRESGEAAAANDEDEDDEFIADQRRRREQRRATRMRNIAKEMHSFNSYVNAHPQLQPLMLPLRDGLTLIRYWE